MAPRDDDSLETRRALIRERRPLSRRMGIRRTRGYPNAFDYRADPPLADVFHHRPSSFGHHLPHPANHAHRLAAGDDLGGVRAEPVPDRPEDRTGAASEADVVPGAPTLVFLKPLAQPSPPPPCAGELKDIPKNGLGRGPLTTT